MTKTTVRGRFTFREDLEFYNGHFKDFPVTPGVILTECCAQIGLVCFGIYLSKEASQAGSQIALTSSEMEFYLTVYPGETVEVEAVKMYYRFNKLKCNVKMRNEQGEVICKGSLAGMLKLGTND